MTTQEQHETPPGVKVELPETVPDPELEYISHNRAKKFLGCQQAYFWSYIELVEKIAKADPLHAGSSMHKAFERLSLGVPFDEVQKGVVDYYHSLPGDDNLADAYMVLGLLHAYVIYYRHQGHHVQKVEWRAWLPLRNPDTGRPSTRFGHHVIIDRVIVEAGKVCIFDHKLVAGDVGPNSARVRKLAIDDQASGYLLAMRELGVDCHEMVYDFIQKPGIRPKGIELKDARLAATEGKYYGLNLGEDEVAKVKHFLDTRIPKEQKKYRETMPMFAARVMTTALAEPEKYFYRHTVTRSREELDDYARTLWATQKNIAFARNNDLWARSTNQCLDMSGRTERCDFCALCFAGRRKLDEGEIPAGYQRRERA